MISLRGSRPKISSDSWTEPASLPSRVVTFSSISRALLLGGCSSLLGAAHNPELAGLRSFLRQRLLDGITHRDPSALGAGNGTLDEDQAARDVGLHHAQIERGDAIDAHVTGHLLVLESLAGILTSAGRTDRTMRYRDTVGGAKPAEIPALDAAGKTLADRGTGDIDELADHEMVGLNFSANRDQRVFGDAELGDLALGLDLGDRKLAALRLRQLDGLARTRTELQRHITVLLGRAVTQHLAIAQLQHGHGDMFAGLRKDPRHPDLLCDHSGAHRRASCSFCPLLARTGAKNLELDLDINTGRQIELHQRIDGLRCRIDNVEKTLVRAHLELLAALLVDMRRTVDGELLDAGRQRDRSANLGTGTFRRVHDLTGRRIENSMVERLETYANILAVHLVSLSPSSPAKAGDPVFRSVAVNSKPRGVLDAPLSRGMTAMLLLLDDACDDAGPDGAAEVELRPVVGEERGVTAALVLGQDVGLGLELGVRLHRTRFAQHLTALDFLALGAAQQRADVVAGLALVQELAEHLNAGDDGLLRIAQAHDLDFLADLDDAALDAAGHHGAAARDREHVFHRHQERLVDRTLRLRNVAVHRLHQFQDRIVAELGVLAFECRQRRTLDDRNIVAREFVLREQFADFHFDELQQLGIVDHVALVQEHDERGNADLAGQQDVLAGLRHRAIGRRNHQNAAVHLRRTGDHVLDVV